MEVFLQVEKATKNYGDVLLFSEINFVINEGDKVALIARNGAGKTTLLNILAGKDTFDSGKYFLNKRIKIGYLEQNPAFNPELTVFESVYGSPGKLMETVRNYEIALHHNDQKLLEAATAKMDFHNAWDLDAKIRQTLSVFRLDDENQKVATLSGGQVKRLAMAVALLNEPDFLILDEPTNHLDLDMVEWLEEYLTRTRITLLLVTHDRYFLERVCNQIVELDEYEAFSYKGNYREFLQKRDERILNKALNVERAQNLLRKEMDWMRRMPKARGTKAKYRIDAFYDLQRQASYKRKDGQIELQLTSTRLGRKILVLEAINKRFDDKLILDNFCYTFTRGEKIGIIGLNGAGKTTFLNIITGELPADAGIIEPGETVIFGYYKQQGMEFKPGQRVIDVVQEIAEVIILGDGSTITAGQFLNKFLFPPEMQFIQVDKLSGGEKRRLYLMTILMRNPNFLILDEPTNDFDIVTLQILEDYLSAFNGCLIVVSHDRFFMDKIVDHLFIFEGDGIIYDFPGNYSEYRAVQKLQEGEKKNEKPETTDVRRYQNTNPSQQAKNKRTFREKKEFELLTAEIEILEKEKAELENSLSSGTLSSDDLMKGSLRIAEIMQKLDGKTDRWLDLSD
jgi:ATP-binding cassette subfamily F protein uup